MGRQTEIENAYMGKYLFTNEDYYIHKHLQNIGRASGGTPLKDAELYKRFQGYKDDALAASKAQYRFLMRNTINNKGLELVNTAFEEGGDEIMSELNKQLGEKLRTSLAIDKLQNLMNIQQDFASYLKEKKVNFSQGDQTAIKAFDKLLEKLSQAISLINSPDGKLVAQALLAQKYGKNIKNTNLKDMGVRLRKALAVYTKEANGTEIEVQQIEYIIKKINILAEALERGKTKEGDNLTNDGIKKIIDNNIFSTGFAEAIVSMMSSSAKENIQQFIIDKNFLSLVGDSGVRLQIFDSKGKPVKFMGRPYSGKADVMGKYIKVLLESKNGIKGGEITIDIGLSNKFYRSYSFFTDGKVQGSLSFSSGSGGSVKQAINALFGEPVNKYLAYNVLAKQDHLPQAIEGLNDLILTRQINRLFAARGGNQDFAQFILVNGVIISIWELILYTKRFLGKSKSMQSDQAIVLSIPDRPQIIEAGNIEDNFERVRQTNKIISEATIKAEVHVNKLLDTMGTKQPNLTS